MRLLCFFHPGKMAATSASAHPGDTTALGHRQRRNIPIKGDARAVPALRLTLPMCRWMAYSGDPILAEELLFRPTHSIIDQSLHSRMGATTTNGDGFGIGWYGEGLEPAVFKSIEPAWNDRNLREIAGQVRTPVSLAHIRASTGTPVQAPNCHPFRHDRWLWMHNGALRDFHHTKRDLLMAVDPVLYPDIEGSTDSETLFFLALTFGLTDDPFDAWSRALSVSWRKSVTITASSTHSRDRCHDQRRVHLGIPLLQRRQEPVAVLLHQCRNTASTAPWWRFSTA